MGNETSGLDSSKTKWIKRGITAAGIGSLVTAGYGPVQAKETVETKGSSKPKATEVVENPLSYEVTVESITGEKIPLATTEILEVPQDMEALTPLERLLSEVELVRLARENNPLLYRVVDSKHPISKDFVEAEIVPNLVDLTELPTLNDGEKVHVLVKKDLMALFEAAKIDGINILVRSGFRSFWQQQYALNKVDGDTSKVALPGESQHQTGLAIDFSTPENQQVIGLYSGFENTKAGKWLEEHAWEYGFVLPYVNGHDGVNPAAEPHHYLYVGVEIATKYYQLKEQEWKGDVFDLQGMICQVGVDE